MLRVDVAAAWFVGQQLVLIIVFILKIHEQQAHINKMNATQHKQACVALALVLVF